MVDYAALHDDSSSLLGAPVIAAGLFVIDIGRVAPMAGGLAGAVTGDVAASALGVEGGLLGGLVEGAGYVAGQHAAYEGSADAAGVTPVMVVAVTADEIALMDWHGDVRSGNGPTTVFARFPRSVSTVTSTRSGPTWRIVLTHDGVDARIQCNLGLLAPGKGQTHAVLRALGVEPA